MSDVAVMLLVILHVSTLSSCGGGKPFCGGTGWHCDFPSSVQDLSTNKIFRDEISVSFLDFIIY
jgi:hypothetical protein